MYYDKLCMLERSFTIFFIYSVYGLSGLNNLLLDLKSRELRYKKYA